MNIAIAFQIPQNKLIENAFYTLNDIATFCGKLDETDFHFHEFLLFIQSILIDFSTIFIQNNFFFICYFLSLVFLQHKLTDSFCIIFHFIFFVVAVVLVLVIF